MFDEGKTDDLLFDIKELQDFDIGFDFEEFGKVDSGVAALTLPSFDVNTNSTTKFEDILPLDPVDMAVGPLMVPENEYFKSLPESMLPQDCVDIDHISGQMTIRVTKRRLERVLKRRAD